jgi:hypothetical protein
MMRRMNSTVAAGWSRGLLSAWMGLVGGVGVGAFFKTDGTSWTASGVIALITGSSSPWPRGRSSPGGGANKHRSKADSRRTNSGWPAAPPRADQYRPTPKSFLYAGLGCAMFYSGLVRPGQLRRRIEVLSTPDRTQ